MPERSIEFCSLQYLNQWLERDKKYHNALVKGSRDEKLNLLREASVFYRVARNLPRKYDIDKSLRRLEPILEKIDPLKASNFKENPEAEINKISNQISAVYGGSSVLSLTTKFLWLKFKNPILIYDSQARSALGSKNGDLHSFYAKWRSAYSIKQDEIKSTCEKLSNLSLYTVNPDLATSSYINKISSEDWFHERVFDIYLWNKGDQK